MKTSTITTIKVGNVIRKECADKFVSAIHGKTYMDFQVCVYPVGGSLDVSVSTTCDEPREEIEDMLRMIMFDAIIGLTI